jgi:hypothetical protein
MHQSLAKARFLHKQATSGLIPSRNRNGGRDEPQEERREKSRNNPQTERWKASGWCGESRPNSQTPRRSQEGCCHTETSSGRAEGRENPHEQICSQESRSDRSPKEATGGSSPTTRCNPGNRSSSAARGSGTPSRTRSGYRTIASKTRDTKDVIRPKKALRRAAHCLRRFNRIIADRPPRKSCALRGFFLTSRQKAGDITDTRTRNVVHER